MAAKVVVALSPLLPLFSRRVAPHRLRLGRSLKAIAADMPAAASLIAAEASVALSPSLFAAPFIRDICFVEFELAKRLIFANKILAMEPVCSVLAAFIGAGSAR